MAQHEEWLAAYKSGQPPPFLQQRDFTSEVISALNLFRHEKIGKWEDRWGYLDDLSFDSDTQALARRAFDRKKQDAL